MERRRLVHAIKPEASKVLLYGVAGNVLVQEAIDYPKVGVPLLVSAAYLLVYKGLRMLSNNVHRRGVKNNV